MKYEGLDIFDMVIERHKDTPGHVVFSLREEKDYADVFIFETEEELKELFDIKFDTLYKTTRFIPKFNDEDEFIIDGKEYDINENEIYHIIDGKIQ